MPSFEDLPPELQLQSLSNLSARDIQKARRVNRHSRNLIDPKSNEILLVQPGIAASRARVQAFLLRYRKYYVTKLDEYGNNSGLLDAFRDFSMLYGIGNAASDTEYLAHLGSRLMPESQSEVSEGIKQCGVPTSVIARVH